MEKIDMKENTEEFEKCPLQTPPPRTEKWFTGSDMVDGFDGLLLSSWADVCMAYCLEVSLEALAVRPELGYPDQDGPVSAWQQWCSLTWPNIDIKCHRTTLDYYKRTILVALPRCTLAVMMNEYKPGTLKDAWNIYRWCAMSIGRNLAQCAYLVPPGTEAGNWRHCWQWNSLWQWEGHHKPALTKNIPSTACELSWFPKAPMGACLSIWGHLNRLTGLSSRGDGKALWDHWTLDGRMCVKELGAQQLLNGCQIFDMNCDPLSHDIP